MFVQCKQPALCFSVCLVMWLLNVGLVAGQNPICRSLQELHREHGESLLTYLTLTEAGQDCLGLPSSANDAPHLDPIWNSTGSGPRNVSVDFVFSPGIYHLNMAKPEHDDNASTEMTLRFEDIIEEPDDCFPSDWPTKVFFPSLVEIDENCRIYATFDVYVFSYSKNRRPQWDVSITRFDPSLTRPYSVDGWSDSGRSGKYTFVDWSFTPGIYRLNLHKPKFGDWGKIWLLDIVSSPDRCFDHLYVEFPSQFRVDKDCRVHALLDVELEHDHENTNWEISITRLE